MDDVTVHVPVHSMHVVYTGMYMYIPVYAPVYLCLC